MNLTILHYHLNRGGVTSVIANHLRALKAAEATREGLRAVILHGGRRTGWTESVARELSDVDVSLQEIPGLEYDEGAAAQPRELAEEIRQVLDGVGFTPETTIIHAHNHALGKNVSIPGALRELAAAGYRLLLQIHDFAEDFRPEVYRRLKQGLAPRGTDKLQSVLYPQANQIHYAVLNRRDYDILRSAGLDSERLHLLPNPVQGFASLPPREAARSKLREKFAVPADARLLVYPVRGIRRKNLGEALAWSLLAGEGTRVGLTLAPLNPVEKPSYERWEMLAAELRLPVAFELGGPGGLDFLEVVAAADIMLTTSVAEGFGLAFLECWLAGRGIVGRDLPEITSDFVASGLRLDGLRPKLRVPVDWFDRQVLGRRIIDAYDRVADAYERPPLEATQRDGLMNELTAGGNVDFGVLDSALQRETIARINGDSSARVRMLDLNPWIDDALHSAGDDALVQQNAAAVRSHYGLEPFGRKLSELYASLIASPSADEMGALPAGERILDEFVKPTRFHPIRSES